MGQQGYYPQYIGQIPQGKTVQFLKILLSKEIFFQEEEIKGEIWVLPPQPLVLQDIILKLRLFEGWFFQETSNVLYSDTNDLIIYQVPLNLSKLLNVNTQLINMHPGEFKFPFSLKIPKNIHPSFEFPMPNRRAYIRYSVIADVVSPYFKCVNENLIVIKSRPYVLNVPLKISNTSNVHKWGMIDKGSTTLTVSYPTTNYKFGDQIPLTVDVNNTRGKLNVIASKFSIIRKITFSNRNQTSKFPIEKTIFEYKYPINIPVGNSNSFNFSVIVNDPDVGKLNYTGIYNPFPFIKDYNILMPCVDGTLVKCRYFIHVSLSFSSIVTHSYKPRVDLPIWVTHQTMDQYLLEKKEDEELEKVIEISKIDYNSNFSINDDNNNNQFSLIDNNDFNEGSNNNNNNNNNNEFIKSNYDFDSKNNFNRIPFQENHEMNFQLINENSDNNKISDNNYKNNIPRNDNFGNNNFRNNYNENNNYSNNNGGYNVQNLNNNYNNNNYNNNIPNSNNNNNNISNYNNNNYNNNNNNNMPNYINNNNYNNNNNIPNYNNNNYNNNNNKPNYNNNNYNYNNNNNIPNYNSNNYYNNNNNNYNNNNNNNNNIPNFNNNQIPYNQNQNYIKDNEQNNIYNING